MTGVQTCALPISRARAVVRACRPTIAKNSEPNGCIRWSRTGAADPEESFAASKSIRSLLQRLAKTLHAVFNDCGKREPHRNRRCNQPHGPVIEPAHSTSGALTGCRASRRVAAGSDGLVDVRLESTRRIGMCFRRSVRAPYRLSKPMTPTSNCRSSQRPGAPAGSLVVSPATTVATRA